MFCVIPSCSASVFDLVAVELDGGWERKKERGWLVLAVKSPSVNELSSADRSSHTFKHTPSSSAADLRFGKIFIHKNLKWTPISVWLLKLSIKIFKTASGMTFSCQFIDPHKHAHTHRHTGLSWGPNLDLLTSMVKGLTQSRVKMWTEGAMDSLDCSLQLPFSFPWVLKCVCVSRLRVFPSPPQRLSE